MICITAGVCMVLYNLEQNIVFFLPPSRIQEISHHQQFRVGGLVKPDSVVRISPNEIRFIITDNIQDLEILYEGVLPALFREKQGIIAVGHLSDNKFIAKQLLSKHDEYYYPPTNYRTPAMVNF